MSELVYSLGRKVHLVTERMVLCQFEPTDVGLMVELDSDPEVTRFINGGQPIGVEVETSFIEAILAGYVRHPGYGFFAALGREDGTFLGWFHYRPDRVDPSFMQIGYRLKRDFWGKGFATEGSRALIATGLEAGVHLVSGRAMKANVASVRVLEKLGLALVEEYQEDRFPGYDKTAVLLRGNFSARVCRN